MLTVLRMPGSHTPLLLISFETYLIWGIQFIPAEIPPAWCGENCTIPTTEDPCPCPPTHHGHLPGPRGRSCGSGSAHRDVWVTLSVPCPVWGKGVGTPFRQQRNLDRRRAQGINPTEELTQDFPTPSSSQFLTWSRACVEWNEVRSVGSPWLCPWRGRSVFQWDQLNASVDPKF